MLLSCYRIDEGVAIVSTVLILTARAVLCQYIVFVYGGGGGGEVVIF